MSNNFKTLKRIADIVASHYDVHVMSMFPNSRYQVDADRRQVFHYMATRHTRASLQEIGDFSKSMGRKKSHNHATVLHSAKNVKDYMHVDKTYRMEIKELENKIYKAVSLINESSKVRDKQVQSIIDRVFGEDNIEYLELVHLLIEKIYENKNIEELSHLIFLQHKMNNERIYKTSQVDSRLGMV
jgi:dihydroxyacetone kinase-like predicted kinase